MPVNISGNIRKMQITTVDDGLIYTLPIGENHLLMNELIGKTITLSFSGVINCVHCAAKTKKSFQGGHCWRCFKSLAQCDQCIIKPELCGFSKGECRDPEWGKNNCFKPHMIYVSQTGAESHKVGITRHMENTVSSRWLDQGATTAIPVVIVQNRLLSGLVEVAFKEHISDRTNWRKMLKFVEADTNIDATITPLLENVKASVESLQHEYGADAIQWVNNASPVFIEYPVVAGGYPEKVKSINLDKTPSFSGELTGLKGQYLMFTDNKVINLRKYAGYHITITEEEGESLSS